MCRASVGQVRVAQTLSFEAGWGFFLRGLSGDREGLRLGGPRSRKVGPPTQKMFPQEEQPRQGEVVRTTSQNKPSLAQGGHTLRE